MTAYYNEHDPFAAAWLRELIRCGHIAPGVVDERSIEDITPAELAGFRQVHLFAGVGVWSYALRRAGWPDDMPVWTGSCPCQPFSAAGKGAGFADERHLWPAFYHLISSCAPVTVFGEQVASKDGLAWLDLVAADLEGAGYAFGAVDTCAAGFGAPHIRQRLYWVADPCGARAGRDAGTASRQEASLPGPGHSDGFVGGDAPLVGSTVRRVAHAQCTDHRGQAEAPYHREPETLRPADRPCGCCGSSGGLADSEGELKHGERGKREASRSKERSEFGWFSPARGLADAASQQEHEEQRGPAADERGRGADIPSGCRMVDAGTAARPTDGRWRDADWLLCRDGKWRPVIPQFIALVDGLAVDMVHCSNYGCGKGEPEKEEVANASCTQEDGEEAMRVLRKNSLPEEVREAPRGLRGIHAEEVLRASVHGEIDGEEQVRAKALQGKGAPRNEDGMRNMWQEYFSACSPQERGCFRQHPVELDDIMRQLPQARSFAEFHGDRNTEIALHILHERFVQESDVQHSFEQASQVWASLGEEEKSRFRVGIDVRAWRRLEFFPLESGAAARVGRLRGYGNAIVAPQAEAFIRAYMQISR